MKLFSATQLKERTAKEEAKKQLTLIELHNKKSVLMKEVGDLQKAKESMINKFNKEYGEYVREKKTKARLLENEVVALEKRREQAMKPISELRTEAENRMQEVIKVQSDLKNRESVHEENKTELSKRLKQLEIKELEVIQEKSTLIEKRKEVEAEQKQVQETLGVLNTKIDQLKQKEEELL